MADLYAFWRLVDLKISHPGILDIQGACGILGVQFTPGYGHTAPATISSLEGPYMMAICPVTYYSAGASTFHAASNRHVLHVPRSAMISQVQWYDTDDSTPSDLNTAGQIFFTGTQAMTGYSWVELEYTVEFKAPLDPAVTASAFLRQALSEEPKLLSIIEERIPMTERPQLTRDELLAVSLPAPRRRTRKGPRKTGRGRGNRH
jgi:hypothetical protein